MLCVALAAYTQSVTGFAFSLVLLGLVGMLELGPLADAANAASCLVIVNAVVYLRQRRPLLQRHLLVPTLASSLPAVVLGVFLLAWLSGNSVQLLRALLGLAIVVSAMLLLFRARPLEQRSSTASFVFYGSLGGVLGGLFSSSGPPLVYHMYRQPLKQEVLRQTLLVIFACNALLRLAVVLFTGTFSSQALLLVVEAVPVVYAVTWWQVKHGPKFPELQVKRIVAGLLVIAGGSLIWSSARHLAVLVPAL
jgi:uncharacterized protein